MRSNVTRRISIAAASTILASGAFMGGPAFAVTAPAQLGTPVASMQDNGWDHGPDKRHDRYDKQHHQWQRWDNETHSWCEWDGHHWKRHHGNRWESWDNDHHRWG